MIVWVFLSFVDGLCRPYIFVWHTLINFIFRVVLKLIRCIVFYI